MLFGFLVLLVGGAAPWLGDVFGTLCGGSLQALNAIIDAAHGVAWARYWVPGPDDWWMSVFYLALALFVAMPRRTLQRRWWAALAAGWVGVAFAVGSFRALPRDQLDVTFLSVGHGEAVVIELPDGRTVLYDAGHMGSPDAGGRSIASFLWSRGITRLDALIVSHADADHFNAVPYLLERFDVAQVIVSPVMFHDRGGRKLGAAVQAFRAAVETSGTPLVTAAEGERLATGGDVALRVLLPPAEGFAGSDNANSVVLSVEYRGRRILLTGDLEGAGLRHLLDQPPHSCDVLLAPHHGSLGSSPADLADWASPDYVVVSGGFRANMDLLNLVYGEVNATALHTARVGAIRVSIDGDAISVHTLGGKRFTSP
jgi:competence protein ComEC